MLHNRHCVPLEIPEAILTSTKYEDNNWFKVDDRFIKDRFYAFVKVILFFKGSFKYSDDCPILKSEWSIVDLTGEIIQNYTRIPGNGFFLYNDKLNLKNNVLYIIKVKITDALNRTKIGKSDGVTVRIQPPVFGTVRDGLGSKDIDYQFSYTQLSANWDSFGDTASNDPTQQMDHYEVSIGDDTTDHSSRTNVHYFTNVGLNQSYTFSKLNLTSKTVQYFITVRGYSITGAFEESYSNGIRVGYRLEIIQGTVETKETQRSNSEIHVSWTGFESDIGIEKYYVSVSSTPTWISNHTFSCHYLKNFSALFDVVYMMPVGLDTFVVLTNLSLKHGEFYYVTVVAYDEMDQCGSSISKPILVDITPPDSDQLSFTVNGWNVTGRKHFYVTDSNEIEIQVQGLNDPESGINTIEFRFFEYTGCPALTTNVTSSLVQHIVATNDPRARMTNLELQPHRYYYIDVIVSNNAGLVTKVKSPVMLLDTSAPHVGSAKMGNDWMHDTLYQSSTTTIEALTAIARTEDAYICDTTKTIFPTSSETAWFFLSGDFSAENVVGSGNTFILNIGYNIPLTKVLKSGIFHYMGELYEGKFSTTFSSAKGNNISTSVIISTSKENPFFPTILTRPQSNNFDNVNFQFNDSESLNETNKNSSRNQEHLSTTEKPGGYVEVVVNDSGSSYNIIDDVSHGFGFHVIGDQQTGSNEWDCLFWAKDANGEVHKWVNLNKNPFDTYLEYSIKTRKRRSGTEIVWDLQFAVDGDVKADMYGLTMETKALQIYFQTWNIQEFEEPIIDPIHPYRSKATFKKMKIPSNITTDCTHGAGFYDKESGIAEIWAGVSDNSLVPGNIKNMFLYQSLCSPCLNYCNFRCDANCSVSKGKLLDFEKIPIKLENLELIPTNVSNDGLNATVVTKIKNMTEYYVNVKVVNFAGQSVMTTTNPVVIDTTPPVCEYVNCLDPVITGMDMPTDKLGSNRTIGAYWLCDDNVSGIKKIYIKVGTKKYDAGNKEDENMYAKTEVKSDSKIRIDLADNVYFEDRKTYFVNLLIYNGAGVPAMFDCNVSTLLTPPDVSNVDSRLLHSSERDIETGTDFVDSLDRFGISWNNHNNDTRFYSKYPSASKLQIYFFNKFFNPNDLLNVFL